MVWKELKEVKRGQVNETSDIHHFTNIYQAQGLALCWVLKHVVNMPTDGLHKAYSLVGLGQRLIKRKLNTAFTTAFQCHRHIYYLVPGYLWRPRAMTLDKRDMSRAGGSWLREAKRKGLGQKKLQEWKYGWSLGNRTVSCYSDQWKVMGIQTREA